MERHAGATEHHPVAHRHARREAPDVLQRFALRKDPLSRRASPQSLRGEPALTLLVDDEAWSEEPTLFDRKPDEKIYALEQQDDGKTVVQFGDGVNGARLPSGRGNVRARYAVGLGRGGNVRPDQVSILLTRPPGLREVTNPSDTRSRMLSLTASGRRAHRRANLAYEEAYRRFVDRVGDERAVNLALLEVEAAAEDALLALRDESRARTG